MSYYKVAEITDIDRKSVIEVDLNGFSLLLYQDEDNRFFCIRNFCTHDNAALFGGTVEDGTIACPKHGSKFDLKTGVALTMPAVVGVEVFPVKAEGNEIFVGIED
ncbi:MAG: non-heme iron oxygenase ferredoxin subunit [Nitrospinota bacterium]